MAYSARVLLDSVSPAGSRLTTLEVTYPRFVHSELLTHRMLSRNSSSSRAIPVVKLLRQVREDPAMPVWWGKNQRGMQAREELTGEALERAKREWLAARDRAVAAAELLAGPDIDLHKQISNRVLEPWMFITVLVSATEWENFYGRRCEKDAQPEIQKAAYLMRDAMEASKPVQRIHHFPFIDFIDHEWVEANYPTHEIETLSRLSVARCARVSYLTHDGVHDPEADLALAGRLAAAGHWSPFEHVAMAAADATKFYANFRGWKQYRSTFPGESGTT